MAPEQTNEKIVIWNRQKLKKETLRLVHTVRFSDPIFSLALSQLIEMLICVGNFLEFELKSEPKIGSCEPALSGQKN